MRVLRNLHLHLIADAVARIAPEVRHHEAAGRGGRHQRLGHVVGGDAAQSGPLAVDLHFHGRDSPAPARIAGRASEADVGQLLADLGGVGPAVGEVRAADGHLDRRARAEAHDLVDDVGRLEGQPQRYAAVLRSGPRASPRPRCLRAASPQGARAGRWRRRSCSSSTRIPHPSLRATRSTTSSGPAVHR